MLFQGMKPFTFLALFFTIATWQVLANPMKYQNLNNRPIIAVIAQRHPKDSNESHSYIAASYVKYLESAGARVVPIPHYFNEKKIAEIFTYVNGVLYPGGDVTWFTSDYYKHAKQFWDLAIAANDKGVYFPIWGTCLGFEALHVIREGKDILSKRVSSGHALALAFTKDAQKSRLFKDIPEDIFKALRTEDITYNSHHFGITRETYKKYPNLENFFKVLSVNIDIYGKEFISTIEAYKYPIYGVQWHPEKNNFEFAPSLKEIPHSANAVRASQYMANFFVNEARKNLQRFPSKEMEEKYLVYNYKPFYSAHSHELSVFEQVYYFEG